MARDAAIRGRCCWASSRWAARARRDAERIHAQLLATSPRRPPRCWRTTLPIERLAAIGLKEQGAAARPDRRRPRRPTSTVACPADEMDLALLPGVGDYVCRAVLTFGFGRRQVLVDRTTARVAARVTGHDDGRRFQLRLDLHRLSGAAGPGRRVQPRAARSRTRDLRTADAALRSAVRCARGARPADASRTARAARAAVGGRPESGGGMSDDFVTVLPSAGAADAEPARHRLRPSVRGRRPRRQQHRRQRPADRRHASTSTAPTPGSASPTTASA